MTAAYFGSGATLGVYFSPTTGVTGTPTWVDITADVVIDSPITINRGRSSERDTFQTGTLSLTLLNTARKYDPEHSSGTYFGNLLPGRPIKVELTYSGSTSVLFRGFIQGWPQSWETSDNKSVVTIVAHDAFKYLALAQLPESHYYSEVTADAVTSAGWAWWRLGEADGETIAADASGNGYDAPYSLNANGNVNSVATDSLVDFGNGGARAGVDGLRPVVGPALGLYCVGLAFTFEAWVRFPDALDSSNAQYIYKQQGSDPDKRVEVYLAGFSGNLLVINVYETSSSSLIAAYTFPASALGQRNHIAFVRNGSSMDGYFNGVQFATTGGTLSALATSFGYPATIGAASNSTASSLEPLVFDEVAIYLDDLTSTRIAAHYEAGARGNAGETVDERISRVLTEADITWLSTSLGASQVTVRGTDYSIGGSVLGYLQALERTEQGRVFIAADGTLTLHTRYRDQTVSVTAAFTDASGGSLPYVECVHEFDDTRVVNDVVASRTNGVPQRYTDTTSRDAYGLKSLTIDGAQGQSDGEMYDLATGLVARYKDPAARIRALVVKPRANAAGLFPVVRTLDIGSKVTVRRLPLGTGSAFTKTLMVEGVSHSIGADGEWVTTYLTAPADPNNYLIIDDATYGQVDQEKVGY